VIVAAILLATLAVTLIKLLRTQAALDSVQPVAVIQRVELRNHREPLIDYLLETNQPTGGFTPVQQRQAGLVYTVRFRLIKLKGKRVSLAFRVFNARTASRLRPSTVYSQTVGFFVPQADDHSRSWPAWIPPPPRRQRIFVRFALSDPAGRPLAARDSPPVLVGP
jgi:hypothetical protein